MQRQSILKGTAILSLAALVVKLLGAAYRIPLARLIGAEGIGLYQMAYPIYLIFLGLSTAGIPLAISRFIAAAVAKGDRQEVRLIFRASLLLMLLLGTVGAGGMGLAATWLAQNVVADPRAVYAMWALAPSIFFMSLMAAFRGYFQGWQEMVPSAISQVIEQLVRVVVAMILAVILLKQGLEHAAAGAAFGATAGGAAGLIYLGFLYLSLDRQKYGIGKINFYGLWRAIKRIVKYAMPIALAIILMPILQTLDTLIVPARLQSIGYSIAQATALLGVLGNSWAVLYLPLIVTTAMAANLVPALGALEGIRDRSQIRYKIEEGMRLATIYLVPASVLFFLFGEKVYRIIFGVAGVEVLCWVAPAVLCLGLQHLSAAVLQGLEHPKEPLYNFLFGAVVKVGVTSVATVWPGLNLAGAVLGTVCGSFITLGLNLLAIKRLIGNRPLIKLAPIVAGVIMLSAGWYLKHTLTWHYIGEMLLISGVGCLVYLGILRLLGGIKAADIELVKGLFQQRRVRHEKSD